MKPFIYISAMAVLLLNVISAQGQDNRTPLPVRGEVIPPHPIAGSLTVELSGYNGSGGGIERADVGPDNSFEFHSATPGMHQLQVVDNMGHILYSDNVNISAGTAMLTVRLAEAPANNRATGAVISLQQLEHKVPAAARKAFQKGQDAAAKRDLVHARSFFQEAVTDDPEFAEAYNDLGGVDCDLKDYPSAAADFQKAIDLVPEHPRALPNLSIVLAKMHRLEEAGQVARRALRAAPADGRLHYIIGASLLSEPRRYDEAITEFERAAEAVPSAHVTLADLLAKRGRSEDAIRHLEDFLAVASANDPLRPQAQASLAALRQ
jgi:tetratricopeptide (TPR) repeat protein